jgi:hypothetical protein
MDIRSTPERLTFAPVERLPRGAAVVPRSRRPRTAASAIAGKRSLGLTRYPRLKQLGRRRQVQVRKIAGTVCLLVGGTLGYMGDFIGGASSADGDYRSGLHAWAVLTALALCLLAAGLVLGPRIVRWVAGVLIAVVLVAGIDPARRLAVDASRPDWPPGITPADIAYLRTLRVDRAGDDARRAAAAGDCRALDVFQDLGAPIPLVRNDRGELVGFPTREVNGTGEPLFGPDYNRLDMNAGRYASDYNAAIAVVPACRASVVHQRSTEAPAPDHPATAP